ncbi:hypothetical protein BSL78_15399 [Apostichopus japonicus]|uniref:Uncharacterized protein n=1 Tax=Stichopus japonicus TaxID=307972 RepID=A0A2G8KID6_STIJA|nr:hypothetical protein BSL78_15399 [Apostichopus japonicus]
MKTEGRSLDVANSSHIDAVYRQCWPHPATIKRQHGLKIHQNSLQQSQSKSFESSFDHEDLARSLPLREKVAPLKEHHAVHHLERDDSRMGYKPEHRSRSLHADLGLDQGTLHWKTWRNFKEDLDNIDNDAELYKITQDTFRQLTRQVREVSLQMNKKYTGCGLKSYHSSNPYQSLVIHPSRLAASLPSHSPSIQDHRNLQTNPDFSPSVEISPMKKAARKQRPQSHNVRTMRRRIVAPGRPKSSQLSSEKQQGNYDYLSPKVLGKFVADMEETESQEGLGPFEIVAKGYLRQFTEVSESEEDDDDEVDYSKEARNQYSTTDLENLKWDRFRQEKEYMQKKLLGVRLLPEVFNPEDSLFEYRSSNASSPEPDPFPETLSEPYCYMDLLELTQEKDWRQAVRKVPEEKDVELIMDRLIEMERFQEETSKTERRESLPSNKKTLSQLEEKKGWNADAAKPTERAQSNLSRKGKSKNCSDDCLQPVCSGECIPIAESKGCPHCRGRQCRGQCTEYRYHLHVRRPREGNPTKPRPKSCVSCAKNGRKVLNRQCEQRHPRSPRSAFSTFSSTQQMKRSKECTKMTYTNENGGGLVSQRLEQLQLSVPWNVKPLEKKRNPRPGCRRGESGVQDR